MWEYNAPQYVDFTKRFDDDTADAYFGMNRSAHTKWLMAQYAQMP